MIRYHCDMCKCDLDPKHDVSYVVRMQVYPTPVEVDGAIDDDRDHLADIHEVLERYDEFDMDGQLLGNDTYHQRRFDLCGECCKRFLLEPLGPQAVQPFDFMKH